MKLLCISASNVSHKKHDSASTKICDLAGVIAGRLIPSIEIDVLQLADAELSNCIFCGQCMETGDCVFDEVFNHIYDEITVSDRVLWVVPFYSVIPSKITMIMEKLNQIYYTAWLNNPDQPYPLKGKKTAIIGHCGSDLQANPQMEALYRELLLKPLNYSLASLGFDVVGLDAGDAIKGVLLGVQGYAERDDAIFPDMVHDWPAIEERITPLVSALIQ